MKRAQEQQVGAAPLLQWTLWEYLQQMQLLVRDLKKATVDHRVVQQNLCQAQDRLSRLESAGRDSPCWFTAPELSFVPSAFSYITYFFLRVAQDAHLCFRALDDCNVCGFKASVTKVKQ